MRWLSGCRSLLFKVPKCAGAAPRSMGADNDHVAVRGPSAVWQSNTAASSLMCAVPHTPQPYTRDLHYSFETLIENFLDPAHVPFAHHGVIGNRSHSHLLASFYPHLVDFGMCASCKPP